MILYNHDTCAYWPEGSEYDDNVTPLCSSVDGKTGYGAPGGVCATCALNQYGSVEKGKGKACKNMRNLYILRSGEHMPSFLYDIAAFSDYARNRKNTVYELFEGIRRTMVNIELKGPAVFIGRCSTVILGESPRVLKSFIYSSDTEKRVERIIRTENVSETDAKYLMQKKDRDRKNYFRFWTQKEWADKSNYDILLNTSGVSTEACAQMLLAAISGQPQK